MLLLTPDQKLEYPEMVLSNASFRLEGDYSDPDRLEALARKLYNEWKGIVVEHYDLEDYGLVVVLEEGSLKGLTRLVAAAGVVYGFIAGYGSFRSGIDYMVQDGKAAAEAIRSKSPLKDEIERNMLVKFAADAGVITQVDRILNRVKLGQLSPDEGRVLILNILETYGDVPSKTVADIEDSLRTMPRAGEQLSIEVESLRDAASKKQTPRKPRVPQPAEAHWVIEVSSRSRKEKPTVERKRKK
ncbi:MAG: hypothetical protein JST38_21195 [Bacteroidetes bacterium]|nr:hypothetical protein [Bacteroidota bacterium]